MCALAVFAPFPATGIAQVEHCAVNLAEVGALLGHAELPRTWREVSMNDGKPLTLALTGEGDALHLSFVKSGEGLWAEGPVRVCRRSGRVFATIQGARLTVGPAANWILRRLLAGDDASFELALDADGRLRASVRGWRGDFVRAGH